MSVKQRGFFGGLWDFFCSLKLTIFILIALAITSIIGTVIQQNLSRQEYLRVFSEDTYRLLNNLQFFDMYHSWWFIGLLVLFCINLVCCSIKRLPRVWRLVQNPSLTPSEQMLKAFSNVDEKLVKGDLPTLIERMKAFVGAEFATAQVNEKDGSTYLYAEKAQICPFRCLCHPLVDSDHFSWCDYRQPLRLQGICQYSRRRRVGSRLDA